jgi:hypothetical protein
VRKSEASSSTDKQPSVQASLILPSSQSRMGGAPSYPTPTSMRSSLTTCWSISSVAKSARQLRIGEVGGEVGGPVLHRAWYR